MKAEVRFIIPELEPSELSGVTAVVVDVVRATSTIITALANGARAVYPVSDTEEAMHLVQSLGREDTLLCGERKGLRIEGYDLGNSPLECTPEAVRGKRLVMNTTNGTRAFVAAEGMERVLALSFLNLTAVAEALAGEDHVLVLCAGREDVFALEDAVCAGALLRSLEEGGAVLEPDDGARAAMELAARFHADEDFLRSTRAGQALVDLGLEADLSWCARVDGVPMVPVVRERALVLPDPSRD